MNRVCLRGFLTKDPELQATGNGTPVCTFNIAVNRIFKARGSSQTADFINCVCWKEKAESVGKFLRKGSEVIIEGKLQSRAYEANGSKRTVLEVACDTIEFGNAKKDDNREAGNRLSDPQEQFDESMVPIEADEIPFDYPSM